MKTIKCPECRGSGIFENDPSGVFSLDCPVCDGDGEIDKLGIPASAADLTDWDGPDGEK
jgi:DnaJ-class molecular chaperone